MTARPLEGIRVAEFTHMVMGPFCGLVLADLGADVVKIEPAPDGDNTRRLTGAGAGFFSAFNRNKRSLMLDLKSVDGIATVRALLQRCDVLIENFRPGAMDKLGLGPQAVATLNPLLVYCSCKGFLPGPYEHRVALDEVVQMMGGLAYMTGLPGRPMRAGSSVNDIMGGTFGAVAIISALLERARTGRGRHVQSGLFENNAVLVAQHMAQIAVTGIEPMPMGVRNPAWPIYDLFDTADGSQVFIGVVTDTQWRSFCDAYGLADLLSDAELQTQAQRVDQRARVIPRIAAVLKWSTARELMHRCEQLGLPYAPIAKPGDLFDDPHLNASGGLLPVTLPSGDPTKLPALPVTLDGARPGLRHDVPKPGEHNAEILRDLGLAI